MPFERAAILLAMLLCLAVFLAIPALIAFVRKHPERGLIYKLSPLTLFSLILWIALAVWAASDKRNDAVISRAITLLRKRKLLPWATGLLVVAGLAGSVAAAWA